MIHYSTMKSWLRVLTHPAAVSGLTAVALTALLYGDAVTLPLFSDDLVQIPWLESIPWAELWSAPSPYGYYRPLWYSLWRVWGMLLGGLHPPGLHLLNLIAHIAATSLTGLMAAAWVQPAPQNRWRAALVCFPAVLFASFPFSRQAVAWPGALYNPLVGAMAAGAVLAYDYGRHGRGGAWIGLALVLAALSPLTYEAGLMVGPVIVLVECVGWLDRRWPRRLSWWPLAFVGVTGAMAGIWRAMRGSGVVGLGLSLPDVRRNVSYLVQGLVYPVAPLAQALRGWLALDAELSIWLVALPTLTLLMWSGLRKSRGTLLLGLGWFALFALPPVVSMQADWFALAPRYLYMTATGVSLVWTTAVGSLVADHVRGRVARLGALALLILTLMPPVAFIREGLHLYELAGQVIWEASAAAVRERPILLVNLPRRITPRKRIYPLGFEGVTPLPKRVSADGLVYVHTSLRNAAEAVAFGVVATQEVPGYTYELTGQDVGWEDLMAAVRRARVVYLTRYEHEQIRLVEAGGSAEQMSPPREPLARFADRVALMEASATCDEAGRVVLTTSWRAETKVETDATVFAHLLARDGTMVAQADGYPLLGMLPFWLWEPDRSFWDVRYFDAAATPVCAEGCQIRLGLWELATGEHWPAEGHPGGVVLLPVNCR